MPSRTLSIISDEVLAKKGEIKKLGAKVDALEAEKKTLEAELQTAAEAAGLTEGGGKTSKFTVKPHVVPTVKNWDLFYAFMIKKKWLHLLQRRPSTEGCRELWEGGTKEIPGVEQFTKITVTVSEK